MLLLQCFFVTIFRPAPSTPRGSAAGTAFPGLPCWPEASAALLARVPPATPETVSTGNMLLRERLRARASDCTRLHDCMLANTRLHLCRAVLCILSRVQLGDGSWHYQYALVHLRSFCCGRWTRCPPTNVSARPRRCARLKFLVSTCTMLPTAAL